MIKNKKILVGILVVVIILVSGCIEEEKLPTKTGLSPKEKCENSGGSWVNPCETGECYTCDCYLSYGEEMKYKVLKDGECVPCEENEDCGENVCGVARDSCIETQFFCEEGLCRRERNVYGEYFGPKTHDCINNKCVPIK